jgi:outer membrane protein OmpA-like peptidoglycan-associated protein
MVSQGLASSRNEIVGKGELEPLYENETDAGKTKEPPD